MSDSETSTNSPRIDGQPHASPGLRAGRKKPWLAAILSFCWPGLGQLYAGRPRRGLAISLLLAGADLLFFRSKLLQLPVGLFAWIVVGVVVLAAVVFDAAQQARKQNAGSAPPSRWTGARVATAIIILAVDIFSGSAALPPHAKGFKVPSASMCPTICENERVIADMEAYKNKAPQVGDVVMLHTKFDQALYIKRVIGVAGDTVKQGDHGEILVNGRPLPSLSTGSSPKMEAGIGRGTIDFDPVTVPAGSYFLVGDNIDNSLDSRTPEFGIVSAGQVQGKPLYLYWSPVLSRIGCRVR